MLTQQSLSRPCEDPIVPDAVRGIPVAYDDISSDSERALVIDLPTEEDSDDSSDTVDYAASK